jgi:hypothetical protein
MGLIDGYPFTFCLSELDIRVVLLLDLSFLVTYGLCVSTNVCKYITMKLTNNVFGNICENVFAWCPTRSEMFGRNLIISIEGNH